MNRNEWLMWGILDIPIVLALVILFSNNPIIGCLLAIPTGAICIVIVKASQKVM